MYCTRCGARLDAFGGRCSACGRWNFGIHGLAWTVAILVAGLVPFVHKRPEQHSAAVAQRQQHVEAPARKPTLQQPDHDPMQSLRETIALELQQTLGDGGYDITVGVRGFGPPTLLLHGDIYKDVAVRVDTLQTLRSIANDRLCPWGFRQVNIGASLFSGTDFSLHCAGQE
jgi:hypothetical protein